MSLVDYVHQKTAFAFAYGVRTFKHQEQLKSNL